MARQQQHHVLERRTVGEHVVGFWGDPGPATCPVVVNVLRQVWAELGEPDALAVTIAPKPTLEAVR